MSTANQRLLDIRRRIDEIDLELQRLLNQRAACALEVAAVKAEEHTEDSAVVFYRPERETQILNQLRARNEGPLTDDAIAALFREIISCCLSLEQPLTVAYLGPEGTYTEAAALKQFGRFATTRATMSIDEVFRQVEAGTVHYGVVPVENSTEGMVNHTLDCFIDSGLKICAEVELPIHHALLASTPISEQAFDTIEEVVSHQQSLAQCRNWLDANLPGVPRVPVSSNAEAARLVAARSGTVAIASEIAAERYGLHVLARRIEDRLDNKTRFLVIGSQDTGESGSDKTSVLVSAHNEPGELYNVLKPFQVHGVNLTRIETRPARDGDWSYLFFIDFDGHQNDPQIRTMLTEISEVAMTLRVLGSYPRAVIEPR